MKDSVAAWSRNWAQKHEVAFWFESETDSTNQQAKKDFASRGYAHPAPILYLAEHQNQGRGRGENVWINPEKGRAFLGSWSFAATQSPQPIFALLVGLSVYQAFMDVWPSVSWSLKLPNDILIRDKKVAGILIENIEMGENRRTVVGLGVNVQSHPQQFAETATCLRDEVGAEFADEDHWHRFLNALYPRLQEAMRRGFKTELSDLDRKLLLDAVNSNPRLPKPYADIQPSGHPVESAN